MLKHRLPSGAILVALLAALGMASACVVGATQTLGMADNGKAVRMRVGDDLVVVLDANPTTGYTWEVRDMAGGALEQQGEAGYTPTSQTPLPGGGGRMRFTFKAITTTGQEPLTLVYRRTFEQGVPPANTFTVQVTVQ